MLDESPDVAAEAIRESHRVEIEGLKAEHAKEVKFLTTKILVLQHRWQQAESQITDAMIAINIQQPERAKQLEPK